LWLQGKGKIPKYLEEMDEENPVFSRLYSKSKTFNENECIRFDKQLKSLYQEHLEVIYLIKSCRLLR